MVLLVRRNLDMKTRLDRICTMKIKSGRRLFIPACNIRSWRTRRPLKNIGCRLKLLSSRLSGSCVLWRIPKRLLTRTTLNELRMVNGNRLRRVRMVWTTLVHLLILTLRLTMITLKCNRFTWTSVLLSTMLTTRYERRCMFGRLVRTWLATGRTFVNVLSRCLLRLLVI